MSIREAERHKKKDSPKDSGGSGGGKGGLLGGGLTNMFKPKVTESKDFMVEISKKK